MRKPDLGLEGNGERFPLPQHLTDASHPVESPLGYQPIEEFSRRLLEPSQPTDRLAFREGDKVKLIRPHLWGWIPVGAVGQVESLANPTHPVSMVEGRHYYVRFDLTAFNMVIPPSARAHLSDRHAGAVIPEIYGQVVTHVGNRDLELVERGENWGDDYQFEYHIDAIANAAATMTPDDWAREIDAITSLMVAVQDDPPSGILTTRPPDLIERAERFTERARKFTDLLKQDIERDTPAETVARHTRQFFQMSAVPDGGALRPPGMNDETWVRLVAEAVASEPQPDPDDTPTEPMPTISIVTHTGLEPLAETLTLTPLEGLSDSDLSALQDKVEGVGGENWTPELSKLHHDIVFEWERRERLELESDPEHIPDHVEDEGYLDKYQRPGSSRF